MRKIIVIVVMIGIIIFAGSFFVPKGTRIQVVNKNNNINSKQNIDAVIKEINIESNN